jgi:hypothetical protein
VDLGSLMTEMISVLVLIVGIILGWIVAHKLGLFAPASIYIWFMDADLALFLLIIYGHLDRDDYNFTAMPWPLAFKEVLVPTTLIYGILIIIGFISVFNLQKRKGWKQIYFKFNFPRILKRNFSFIVIITFIIILILEIFHFWDIDKSLFWQNNVYLLLNNPDSVGINTLLGRLMHFLLRPLGLLLISAATLFWLRHRIQTTILFALLSIYPFLLALAQNSRWAPLYFAAILLIIIVINPKKHIRFLIFVSFLTFLIFLKVLIGRNTPYQGLSGTIEIFRLIFSNFQFFKYVVSFLFNIFQGAQNLANTFLIYPEYRFLYKILSFSPTISAIDNFDKIMDANVVMINFFVPTNAYAESYFFGIPFFILMLIILFIWLRTMTKLYLRGDILGIVFTVFSFWMIFNLSQYPVRNSMRFIYISLLLGILVNNTFVKNKRKYKNNISPEKNINKI